MSSLMEIPQWASICGTLAPVASLLVFLAPVPTIQKIRRDRTVGSLPLLPYSSMIAASYLWLVYGVMKKEPNIYITNSFGLVCGCYYSRSFLLHCPQSVSPTLPGSVKQHVQIVMSIIIMTTVLAMSQDRFPSAVDWVGRAGVSFCIAMFASPLAALKTVLITQSAASIPLPFTLACVVNCALWCVWGWLAMRDSNVYFPNGIGLLFGLIQLGLKLYFGGPFSGSCSSPSAKPLTVKSSSEVSSLFPL